METATGLAPATIDRLILAGLKQHRVPIEEAEIPSVCRLDRDRHVFERKESLQRLVAAGLVACQTLKLLDHQRPLLFHREVTIYWATGGDL